MDTNLLVYAHRGECEWHAGALEALTGLAESGEPWAIPWPCAHEFVSVVTRPKVFSPPSSAAQAFAALRAWRASPGLRFLHEAPDHLDRLEAMVTAGRIVGAAVHDARVAAVCLSHGVRELWSVDRDFTRVPSLKIRNPLVGK